MITNLKTQGYTSFMNDMEYLIIYNSTERVAIGNDPFFGMKTEIEARYPEMNCQSLMNGVPIMPDSMETKNR